MDTNELDTASAEERFRDAEQALATAEGRKSAAQRELAEATAEVETCRVEQRQTRSDFIAAMRSNKKTWVDVGLALGVSSQRASAIGKRYGIS